MLQALASSRSSCVPHVLDADPFFGQKCYGQNARSKLPLHHASTLWFFAPVVPRIFLVFRWPAYPLRRAERQPRAISSALLLGYVKLVYQERL